MPSRNIEDDIVSRVGFPVIY